jgi:DNA-binding NarL/FixJ family response regulator
MQMNILIVDDHPLFRSALTQTVKQALPEAAITETGSVAGLHEILERLPDADLVLLDLNLPDATGFSALVHLRAAFPALPVIVVSAHEDHAIMQRALAHGALAYIPKSAPPLQIHAAIHAVLAGEAWLPDEQSLINHDPRDHRETDLAERMQSLTPQQFRVLMMLAEGLLNKQIAYTLNVSEATIKAHVTAIFRKMDVQNRTQAVLALSVLNLETPQL